MDFSKYRLEKLLHIVAGVIPGFVALSIYGAAVPGAFRWFWILGTVGYRTKLALAALVALLAGTTINTIVNVILYTVGYTAGSLLAHKQVGAPDVAPWRDPTWRAALSKVLDTPPKDTQFWWSGLYEFKKKQIEPLSGPQKEIALTGLEMERLQNLREDSEWHRWYNHYHQAVLQPSETDVVFYVQRGLHFNLETASVYALASMPFVAAIRHWWCICPALFWFVALVLSEFGSAKNITDRWATLDRQITFLSQLVQKGRGTSLDTTS